VRLLIDANLSPKVAAALRKAGLESVHVGDVGLLTAPDPSILEYAAANALVIVSADSDFGELLAAARGATRPSVVLLRSADRLTSDQQAALLAANLPVVANDLEAGAIVTIARAACEFGHCPSFPPADPARGARAAKLTRA
jgi:predicted nuclease of predicted toxin-antitoxin system